MEELTELVLEMLADRSYRVRYAAAECIGTLHAEERELKLTGSTHF